MATRKAGRTNESTTLVIADEYFIWGLKKGCPPDGLPRESDLQEWPGTGDGR